MLSPVTLGVTVGFLTSFGDPPGFLGPPVTPYTEQAAVVRVPPEVPKDATREQRAALIRKEIGWIERGELDVERWAKEWAGEYSCGDGLGMNVTITVAPHSGVTYSWHGCLGLYDSNHGEIVEVHPDGLSVLLAKDPSESTYNFMHPRLYFIRWADQRFVVPESQMLDFVNAYNEGGFARASMWNAPRRGERRFMRDAPAGIPQLPDRYAKLLRGAAVRVMITAVDPGLSGPVTRGVMQYPFELEMRGGLDRGVFVGMDIRYRSGATSGTIKITAVEQDRCSGEMTIYASGSIVPPAVGMVVPLEKKPEPMLRVESREQTFIGWLTKAYWSG